MRYFLCFYAFSIVMSQVQYNHPELDWQTIETDNFRIHFYSQTETSARKGAFIAEEIFTPLTSLYNVYGDLYEITLFLFSL